MLQERLLDPFGVLLWWLCIPHKVYFPRFVYNFGSESYIWLYAWHVTYFAWTILAGAAPFIKENI